MAESAIVGSFVRQGLELVPISVEVRIQRGLAKVEIFGLPDVYVRESASKLKSAITVQGFEFPVARSVLIQLLPPEVKKQSYGVELAIAVGVLLATGQVETQDLLRHFQVGSTSQIFIYGQLRLDGKTLAPEDSRLLSFLKGEQQARGWKLLVPVGTEILETSHFSISELKDLRTIGDLQEATTSLESKAVQVETKSHTPFGVPGHLQRLAKAICIGEHHSLFLGVPGSGKTTLAQILSESLAPPSLEQKRESFLTRVHFEGGHTLPDLSRRVVVKPHHTTTALAMVGGGRTSLPGEITRANGGTLILDEVFEFDLQVLDALREPMEEGRITISRVEKRVQYPARCLVLATSNLCPCGKWLPGMPLDCRYALSRCRSVVNRLSGPFLDRFQVIAFFQDAPKKPLAAVAKDQRPWRARSSPKAHDQNEESTLRSEGETQGHEEVSSKPSLRAKLKLELSPKLRSKLNRDLQFEDFSDSELLALSEVESRHGSQSLSQRRRLQALRLARSFADLDRCDQIGVTQLMESFRYSVLPFHDLMHR